MSSRTAGNGRERTTNSGQAAKSSNAASPSSSGVQCMHTLCVVHVLHDQRVGGVVHNYMYIIHNGLMRKCAK